MTLTDPTDIELNRAFAVNVLGWKSACVDQNGNERGTQYQGENINWVGSADAVLPWLEKRRWIKGDIDRDQDGSLYVETGGGVWDGCDEPFPFAKQAVVALLRSRGVKVEFTK